MKNIIKIGTRKSKLALIQTDIVKDKIKKAFPEIEVEIVKIDTKGDQILDKSLTSFGGKGVFTAELEAELLSGAVDIAVHSAKDMPMDFPEGLGIGAVLDRADVRDTFVTTTGKKLEELEPGSIVGTSSLRRELLIKEINPYVTIKLLRGNVQTRLSKLRDGQYDGIILAAAGIERLGYEKEEGLHYQYLDPDVFLPAAGQGILAVESRVEDAEMAEILAAIHSEKAECLLMAERLIPSSAAISTLLFLAVSFSVISLSVLTASSTETAAATAVPAIGLLSTSFSAIASSIFTVIYVFLL